MRWAFVCVAALGGCTGFKRVGAHDAGSHDLAVWDQAVPADQSAIDSTPPDAAIGSAADASAGDDLAAPSRPPVDFVCNEPWTRGAARTDKSCLTRQVSVIEMGLIPPRTLTIARTQAGRVGIAYESSSGPDSSDLHVAIFDDASPSPSPSLTDLSDGPLDRVGARSAIAAGANETFHVAYLELGALGNTIYYRALPKSGPPGPREPVAQNFSNLGQLAIAAAFTDDVTVGYFNSTAGVIASRLRVAASGTWASENPVRSMVDATAAGAGQLRLIIGADDEPLVAFHSTYSATVAQPRFSGFNGSAWSASKTIDNPTDNGLSGFSIGHALFGDVHTAAYWAQSGMGVVELRIASWRAIDDRPMIEVIDQDVPAADISNPMHASAIAVDRWGLVHLAILEPNAAGGVLLYKRQTVVAGQTMWLSDVVDDAAMVVAGSGDPSLVDIVVDGGGRPHIGYFNAATGNVLYATRFDR
jgi:hypothetical protein